MQHWAHCRGNELLGNSFEVLLLYDNILIDISSDFMCHEVQGELKAPNYLHIAARKCFAPSGTKQPPLLVSLSM